MKVVLQACSRCEQQLAARAAALPRYGHTPPFASSLGSAGCTALCTMPWAASELLVLVAF